MKIKSKDIEKCLPLLCWEDGCLISKTADITVPFCLSMPQVYSLGKENFEQLHQTWVRALKCLPDNSIVHKQDWFFTDEFKADLSSEKTFLSTASDNHFSGRKSIRHCCFLYLTKSSAKNISTTSQFSALCAGNLICEDVLNPAIIKSFSDCVSRFCGVLEENGIGIRRVSEKEMLGTAAEYGVIEQYLTLSLGKLSGYALCDITCNEMDTKVGDNYLSCFSISDLDQLPSEVFTHKIHDKLSSESTSFPIGYTHSLGFDLPFNHIYNQYFFLVSHKDTIKAIERRGREQQSLSKISRENAINKEFNDMYLNESVINARRCVKVAANILIWDTNYQRLLKKNTKTGSVLANMDCTVSKTQGIVPQIFWGGIPGAASQFPSEMTFLTFLEQACCFIYNESNIESIGKDFGIRLCDRIFGKPLNIDISDYPRQKGWTDNRNKFILGPSGTGKSFFTNHMVRQYYEQGSHVVIVDVGDSYQGLTKMIQETTNSKDGVYLQYSEENPISFNPFYVADGNYTVEKREQLASLIFCLWKNESECITKAEETHISVAISNYIDYILPSGEFPCFDTFFAYLDKQYREYLTLKGVDKYSFDLDNLLQVLSPYYIGGMYHFLLNATENADLLDKRFIVFEIDSIKDHKTLFPVVTLMLMDTFISKMRHPSLAMERKMILIEEAWKAISKSGTAQFIKYLYKTVRKHFGEAIVVTQEVDDIVGNEIIKNTIISNADCKILLDQRKYANRFDEIKQILALSEKETAIALSINKDIKTDGRAPYKEVFITLNGNLTSVYGVEVSKEEYLTYTTEKKEKETVLQKEREVGSYIEAIKSLTNQ
ncbi:MAG: TraG family conjugative transposon ATPase [Paludibacteraceae bacterium]|nr:TraG family conjugative transposon ATPase [Paludibacteraceae bacterium]